MRFTRIIVIGVGLIGGSIAAAARALDDAPQVIGIDPDPATLEYALDHGVVDLGIPAEDAVAADSAAAHMLAGGPQTLVVLATPVSSARTWLCRLRDAGFSGVVTDVASTKTAILRDAEECLGESAAFVGGHPMAGSERSGVQAARHDLFRGAYYVLTPTETTDPDAYRRVHAFVSALGARVISVPADRHDQAVAIVSHVPHVTASALVDVARAHAGEDGDLMRLAAGGFKDTTRIAAGSPELWTGICLDNAESVAAGIEELRDVLGQFAGKVRARDAEGVRSWLAHAAEVRRGLPAQWVPATEQLIELSVPMIDRPGVIAEVTTAVGRAGCNIESIEIDHQSEDTAVLVLVLTDEGDRERLQADLRALGYDPRSKPLDAEKGA